MPPMLVSALSTAPNASLPPAFRKKMPSGDERLCAAGVMFVTPDGDALFLKRKGGDHAGTFAFPAGKVEQDEEPADAARRESIEEIGRLPKWNLAPLDRETHDGVDFATFGQQIDARFDPVLNEESEEYVWAPLDDPPEPLHPGVRRLLEKFFAEEADEPEHESGSARGLERSLAATDEALKIAVDRESVRSFDDDGRMTVEVTNLSKANVCPYRGREIPGWDEDAQTHALGLDPDKIYMMYRHPEELRKSVPTWNGIQLLRKHTPVDADDHKKHDIVGTTGSNASFDGTFLRNSIYVWTREGIELIESEEQRELSCGYHYDPDMTPGTAPDGDDYHGIMRNIRGNHVTLVEEGRAGPDVLVADGAAEFQWAAIEHAILSMRSAR